MLMVSRAGHIAHGVILIASLAPAPVAVPPYEPNPEFQTPTPIQPDHAQPQYMDTFAIQQPQLPQQHEKQQQMQQQKYPIATPLHALQSSPAPVDCTSCHQREMTQIEFESGKTTQSVHTYGITISWI